MRRWMFAVLLAGCGSNGPKYSAPPPEAVDSCALVEKRNGSVLQRNEIWFDDKGRTIQVDGFDGTFVLEYDDSDRVVRATTPHETATWTYEPTRITNTSSHGWTYVFDVDANGRATRWEGPEEYEASLRNATDYQYDAGGRVTSASGQSRYSNSANGPVMIQPFQYTYTYDDQGRLASASLGQDFGVTTYTYSETPGRVTIALAGRFLPRTYTYDFDAAGRIVHAQVDQVDNSGNTASSGDTYSYVDDRVTARSDDGQYELDTSGVCPGITPTIGPADPLPVRFDHIAVKLPNPPADDFDAGVY